MNSIKKLAIFAIFIFIGVSCFKMKQSKLPSEIDFDNLPYKKLSEYGFFKGDLANLEGNEGVLLYEPASALFTDYAHKSRFVWMPKGSKANFDIKDQDKPLDFP
jgi:hypothetical protein